MRSQIETVLLCMTGAQLGRWDRGCRWLVRPSRLGFLVVPAAESGLCPKREADFPCDLDSAQACRGWASGHGEASGDPILVPSGQVSPWETPKDPDPSALRAAVTSFPFQYKDEGVVQYRQIQEAPGDVARGPNLNDKIHAYPHSGRHS